MRAGVVNRLGWFSCILCCKLVHVARDSSGDNDAHISVMSGGGDVCRVFLKCSVCVQLQVAVTCIQTKPTAVSLTARQ